MLVARRASRSQLGKRLYLSLNGADVLKQVMQEGTPEMDALIKVNWRGSPTTVEPEHGFQGGIIGTCFTLSSGKTISCDHIGREMFKPIDGFDACRVFAVNLIEATLLNEACVRRYPEFDACVLEGYTSRIQYEMSPTPAEDVGICRLQGYVAGQTPFDVTRGEDGLPTIRSGQLQDALQNPECKANIANFDIDTGGMIVRGKRGFIFDCTARVGLSGGPAVELRNGRIVGLCCMGWPPDVQTKEKIGAIDLRLVDFL